MLFHSYFFFPVIMRIYSRKINNALSVYEAESDDLPFVSVLISAYNEEKVIAQRILNLLSSSYPKEKLEIWIGSDHSIDKTDHILRELEANYSSVHLLLSEKRMGKGNIMNILIRKAKGDICVLTDANIHFLPDTIFQLVKNFKDPKTGIVSGNILSSDLKWMVFLIRKIHLYPRKYELNIMKVNAGELQLEPMEGVMQFGHFIP